jgi:hypothetical protein
MACLFSALFCVLVAAYAQADGQTDVDGSAGPTTLVLFGAPRHAYSLSDQLEFLLLQLRSVSPRAQAVSWDAVRAEQLLEADHWVVLCPEAEPVLPPLLLSNLVSGIRPVLWVGHAAPALLRHPLFAEKFTPPAQADYRIRQVSYRGREWAIGEAAWIPMQLSPDSAAEVLMSLLPAVQPVQAPAWRQGPITFFSGLPAPGRLGFLFNDLLVDFCGRPDGEPSRLLLRIDDYQAGSDHPGFQRKVDFLASRGRPFIVSVTPSWRVSPTGAVVNLDAAPEYVTGLRYAQLRGGRILLRGCVRRAPGHPEFWDADLDRPLTNRLAEIRRQIETAAALLLKHGLLPLGWETPEDAASQEVYQEVARVFSTAVERPQLSDLTCREAGLLSRATRDRAGRFILPENLGFVPGESTNGAALLREQAELISQLRGTVAGVYFHAYLPQEKLTELMGVLEGLKKPFLDLSSLDNWTRLPGRVLLTGGATRTVHLPGGVLTWKAFARSGRLVLTEQEFALPGERTLRRKGKGEFELYEFNEATP